MLGGHHGRRKKRRCPPRTIYAFRRCVLNVERQIHNRIRSAVESALPNRTTAKWHTYPHHGGPLPLVQDFNRHSIYVFGPAHVAMSLSFIGGCLVVSGAYVEVLAGHPLNKTGLGKFAFFSWFPPPIVYPTFTSCFRNSLECLK